MRAQDGGNYRGVGLGAAHQKVHVSLRGLTGLFDECAGMIAVGIHAIAVGLLQIGAFQRLQNIRVTAFAVVTKKKIHR